MSYAASKTPVRNPQRTGERERPGPLAYDSLAADSIRADGAYLENKVSEPLGVRGYQSTLNTEDTSAATVIPPATDAEARLPETSWRKQRALGDSYEPLRQPHRPLAYNLNSDDPDVSQVTDTGDSYDAPRSPAIIDDRFEDTDEPSRAAQRGFQKSNYQNPTQAAQPGYDSMDTGVYEILPEEID